MEEKRFASTKLKNAFYLVRALGIIRRCAPGWTAASVVILFVQGVLPLLSLYFMKRIVDAVTAAISSPDRNAAFGQAALYIGLMAGVALFTAVSNLTANVVREAQGQAVTDYVYDILHDKSIEVDLEYYENSEYFDTLHRAQQEAPYRPARIVNGFIKIGQNGISLAAITALLFSFNWIIAVILFLAAVPGVLLRLRFANKIYRWQRERTPTERKSWYLHWLLTGDVTAKEIRLFNLGSHFIEGFRDLRQKLRGEKLALNTKRSLADFVGQASALLAIFGSLLFIAHKTALGAITLGALVMYYQAFQRGQGFLQEFLGGLADLYEDNLFLSYLYEFLDLKPKIATPSNPRPVPKPMKKGIVFDRVSFQYPSGASKVLEEISLTIPQGHVVAFVGENGSGKTTLVKLLCRLYDPLSGMISLDGMDLRDFATADLRREFSVIFQDYAKYHVTALDNIWFGNIDSPPEKERIIEAAKNSGAHDVIERLPRGYDTILGKWFEDGEDLSIGEWQKIALARAFLRDTQLIVLDEPTSSLDARAEYEVFKKFRQLVEGRTAILISHRFSTVRMADFIYVLDGGKIIESGSHDDLVRRGGIYARLFEIQAQSYR